MKKEKTLSKVLNNEMGFQDITFPLNTTNNTYKLQP